MILETYKSSKRQLHMHLHARVLLPLFPFLPVYYFRNWCRVRRRTYLVVEHGCTVHFDDRVKGLRRVECPREWDWTDRGPSSLIRPSIVLAAVEGDVQRLVQRDVPLLMVTRQVVEQRMPGGRWMVALQGEIHLGLLRSLPRRQAVATIDGARADSGRRSATALDPVGRFVARYRVSAKRATAPRQTNIAWLLIGKVWRIFCSLDELNGITFRDNRICPWTILSRWMYEWDTEYQFPDVKRVPPNLESWKKIT